MIHRNLPQWRSTPEFTLYLHISGPRRHSHTRNIHRQHLHFSCRDSNLAPHKLQTGADTTEISAFWRNLILGFEITSCSSNKKANYDQNITKKKQRNNVTLFKLSAVPLQSCWTSILEQTIASTAPSKSNPVCIIQCSNNTMPAFTCTDAVRMLDRTPDRSQSSSVWLCLVVVRWCGRNIFRSIYICINVQREATISAIRALSTYTRTIHTPHCCAVHTE